MSCRLPVAYEGMERIIKRAKKMQDFDYLEKMTAIRYQYNSLPTFWQVFY